MDGQNALFKIAGNSYPENTFSFYNNVLKWIENYKNGKPGRLECEFYFKYLSSSSHKMVNNIFSKLCVLHKDGKNISVDWYYDEGDDDIMEIGNDYRQSLNIPLQLIPKSDF